LLLIPMVLFRAWGGWRLLSNAGRGQNEWREMGMENWFAGKSPRVKRWSHLVQEFGYGPIAAFPLDRDERDGSLVHSILS